MQVTYKPTNSARVLIALSGGVDSSVAAYLTVHAGYKCAGATMFLFDSGNSKGNAENSCGSSADIEDARAICKNLGITHHVLNFTEAFTERVIDRFIAEYERGWTPNPCITCNRFLKFDCLPARAREMDFSHIATGHYARIEYDKDSGRYLLKRGKDHTKDQSYVLYMLTQNQLAHTLLPLGGLTKEQVREIAREQGFSTAEKDESQDICFIPNHDYAGFIRQHSGRSYQAGSITDKQGNLLGTHQGIIDFTVGQRKGIGIAAAHPLYVSEIIPETSTVVVGRESDLYKTTAIVEDINLIACEYLLQPLRATAKHRYRSAEKPATVTQIDEGKLEVIFDEPQKAITKGQALVIYDNDIVIGGGTITRAL